MVLRTQRYLTSSTSSASSLASHFKPALRSLLIPALVLAPFALSSACGGSASNSNAPAPGVDNDKNHLADDLGKFVDANHDNVADSIDINHDGKQDGPGVDTNGDGVADALALDTDCDPSGLYESLDTNGDGVADLVTGLEKVTVPASCHPSNPVTGVGSGGGGAPGVGGAPGMAGSAGTVSHGGTPATAGSGGSTNTNSELGKGTYQGSGMVNGSDKTSRYAEGDVYRNGVGYKFIANGWGTNWKSHSITWKGTSFTVNSLEGSQGSDYSPAGYPSMFCGLYSMKQSDDCGLPIAISTAKSIKTGWRWKANGNNGQYNAAWDIWLGNGNNLSAYLMVWQRDPPGQQPAGNASLTNVTVAGLPGTWNVWKGTVNGLPIINYVQPEGKDLSELEFDVLDVYNDAIKRGNLPGSQILAVAVGYEIWNGPVTNIVTEDFYVDVK